MAVDVASSSDAPTAGAERLVSMRNRRGYSHAVFEKFTEHAREAIMRAQREAREMRHGAVGVEHLLLGLFSSEDDIVTRVWADFGLTIEPVRDVVRERLGVGSHPEG